MISQWYEPEPGAAAHPTAIARALRSRGHEVRVLTGFPNYPRGRIYPEYRVRLRQTETMDGVEVLRVPLYPSHDESGARRALALTSFALSASAQVMWLRQCDVCLVYLTPATVGLAARVLKAIAKVPFVLYVQDLWPESVMASGLAPGRGIGSVVERGIHLFCNGLYRRASHVAAIAPTMAELLVRRGVSADKVSVVYNWIDESVFAPADASPSDGSDTSTFMYAGGIGDVQGLETAVDALALLRDRPDVQLDLVGDGVAVQRLAARAAERGVQDRVHFLGRRPMSDMPDLMDGATAQLISLRDLPLFHATIPSKTQSVMACGLPVVASVPGDSARLIDDSGAGFACPPGDAAALADAMRRMAALPKEVRDEMRANARAYYLHNLSERVGAERLESLLQQAARG